MSKIKVTLEKYTEDPVGAIEAAASTCYNSTPTKGKIMEHCYSSGHHSVLEFADFTFHIEGVSRALSHQLVRHRIASYAQRSQRYCDEIGCEFTMPPSIEKNPEAMDVYSKTLGTITMAYEALKSLGIPSEDARMVLPNATCTELRVKMNLRALIHFCNERLCACAQWEIRDLARKMKAEVERVEPMLAKYLVPKCKAGKVKLCPESRKRTCGLSPLAEDILKVLVEENK